MNLIRRNKNIDKLILTLNSLSKRDKNFFAVAFTFILLLIFFSAFSMLKTTIVLAGSCACPSGCADVVCDPIGSGNCHCPTGDWSCCSGGGGPPPPDHACSSDSCIGTGSNANYYGSCGTSCGIKCTITRDDNTQANSGSDGTTNNTGQCDGTLGTVNLYRSVTNKVSNPARYKVVCTTEESKSGASAPVRNWSVKNISFNNSVFYDNTKPVGQKDIPNALAILDNQQPDSTPPSNAITATMEFISDLTIETSKVTLPSGVVCNSYMNVDKLSTSKDSYDYYSYNCTATKDGTITKNQNQDKLRAAIVTALNGPTYNNVSANKWGTFLQDPNTSAIITNTSTTTAISDSLSNNTITETNACTTNCYTETLSFKIGTNSSALVTINNGSVNCTNMAFEKNVISGGKTIANYYTITCVSTIQNDSQLPQYPLSVLNGTGYKPNGASVKADTTSGYFPDSSGTYHYYDPVSIFNPATSTLLDPPRLQRIITTTNNPACGATSTCTSWTTYLEIKFNDGINFIQNGYPISVQVTDGINNGANIGTASINQTIDTSLPTVSRSISIASMNMFNVTNTATDDHLLMSHSFYVGPTAYASGPNIADPSNYSFVSQQRNNQYLGVNQLSSIDSTNKGKPDFQQIKFNGNSTENNSNFNGKVYQTISGLATATDSRVAQYTLDLTKLSNQITPYDINFGNGNDGTNNGHGKWYAVDSFCNYSGNGNSQDLSVGSPWLQTRSGNVFIKGSSVSGSSNQTLNMSINPITTVGGNICSTANFSTRDPVNFCPEKNNGYASTYLTQSTQSLTQLGPITGTNRASSNNLKTTDYNHAMTNVSSYFNGISSAYDYVQNILAKSTDLFTSCSDPNATRNVTSNGDLSISFPKKTSGGSDLISAISTATGQTICNDTNVNGIDVINVTGGNLNIDMGKLKQDTSILPMKSGATSPSGETTLAGDNSAWPHWFVGTNTIILVNGDVTISAEIRKDLDANKKSLVIIAKGNIDILGGTYKSFGETAPTDYPFYDRIDAFLVADGQIKTEPDVPSGAVVLDGLEVYGGLVQLGDSGQFTTCTLPNGQTLPPTSTDALSNPCFERDLILMHNFLAPAEKIVYDSSIEDTFSPLIGELNTVYTIREVKTQTNSTTTP